MGASGKHKWLVRLGREHGLQFTYERADDSEYRLLGSISFGPAVGALAVTPDGRYLQVNGDYVTPLPAGEIHSAVARAGNSVAPDVPPRAGPKIESPPVVTIKRRRVIARD